MAGKDLLAVFREIVESMIKVRSNGTQREFHRHYLRNSGYFTGIWSDFGQVNCNDHVFLTRESNYRTYLDEQEAWIF
jgi:hypothetical protein